MNKLCMTIIAVVILLFIWDTSSNKQVDPLDNAVSNVNTQQGNGIRDLTLNFTITNKTKDQVRRINSSSYYKDMEEQKKLLFTQKLKKIITRFKKKDSLKEVLLHLTELTGIQIKIITRETPGYGVDEKYANLLTFPPDMDQELDLNFENIPVGEFIRYISILTSVQYKVDFDNEQILLAEQGVILNQNFNDFSVNPDDLLNLTLTEEYKKKVARY